jgi:hypothetical protein
VEEQDRIAYILHLDYEVQEHVEPQTWKWIIVSSESPLFNRLRASHRSHPKR